MKAKSSQQRKDTEGEVTFNIRRIIWKRAIFHTVFFILTCLDVESHNLMMENQFIKLSDKYKPTQAF